MLELALLLVAAFLLGAIPFAYLVVLALFRVDVRKHGSNNPGATNASRCFPKRWRLVGFLTILTFDAGKGYLACTALPALFERFGSENPAYAPALCGLAAVMGHSFSPFLRFRGGKGVATTLGVLLALEPVATLIALGAFGIVYGATRIVSISSLALAIALPLAVYLHGEAAPGVGPLAIALGVLIIVRHRSNISRMLQGTES